MATTFNLKPVQAAVLCAIGHGGSVTEAHEWLAGAGLAVSRRTVQLTLAWLGARNLVSYESLSDGGIYWEPTAAGAAWARSFREDIRARVPTEAF